MSDNSGFYVAPSSTKNPHLKKKIESIGDIRKCCKISEVTASGLKIARMIDG